MNESSTNQAIIVIGIGGAGAEIVNATYKGLYYGVSYMIIDTDTRVIDSNSVFRSRVLIGKNLTSDNGSSANPEIGRLSAIRDIEKVSSEISPKIKMAILVAGMGGGTGTGAAPVIAEHLRRLGIITIAIITTPFSYEGTKRNMQASEGIKNLEKVVNSILVLSNDDLRIQYGNLKMKEAFLKSNESVQTAIKIILDIVMSTGQINVDFDDLVTVFNNGGFSSLGIGEAEGPDRAIMAVSKVFGSPLFKRINSWLNAKWLLVNINSSEGEFEFTMDEVEAIQNNLLEKVGDNCDVIMGLGYDNSLGSRLSVSVIATGIRDVLIRHSKNVFTDENNVLPYAIKQLYVRNYKSLRDLHIANIPIDSNWIFFTGENGTGKSSVLQAIALAILGNIDKETILLQGNERDIFVELRTPYGDFIDSNIKRYTRPSMLACYGPSRLTIQSERSQNAIDRKSSISYSIFNTDGILLNIEHELLLWKLNNDVKFNIVSNLIMGIIPEIHKIEIIENKVFYYDSTMNARVSFEQLPSGYRSIIAFVGDLIVRFYQYDESVNEPKYFKGIVVIDELDLHWHPKWQRTLPKLLSGLFPGIQFIATTHSAMPFLGAPKNSTFFKFRKNLALGTYAEKIEIDVINLLPNLLLTSSLFDMDDIGHIENNDVGQIRTEDHYEEMLKNLETEEALKLFERGEMSFPKHKNKED